MIDFRQVFFTISVCFFLPGILSHQCSTLHMGWIDNSLDFLSCTKSNFDIIGVIETRITKQVCLLNNLYLNNYSYEFTPTETTAGGTLLYIANPLSCNYCNDLNIYKKNELESTFIEIINPKKPISLKNKNLSSCPEVLMLMSIIQPTNF